MDKTSKLTIEQLQEQIKQMQKMIMDGNRDDAQMFVDLYAGLPIVNKVPTVSLDEYTRRMSELEASNQKKLAEEPSMKYDKDGKIVGYNEKKIFARPNGYETRVYMLVEEKSTKYILDTNEVLKIDMNRLESGFMVRGVEVEGKKISHITIDARTIPMYRLPQTPEEADTVYKLRKELGYL